MARSRWWRGGISRARGLAWTRASAFGLGIVALVVACGTAAPPGGLGDTIGGGSSGAGQTGVCTPGTQGCPCTQAGQMTACGSVVSRSGDYVTCSMGQSTCDGHTWGVCIGNTIVQKSLTRTSLGGSGLHIEYTSVGCATPDSGLNECDPNPNCTGLTGQPTDVDAANVFTTDSGGITLQPNDAGVKIGPTCTGLQCQVMVCTGDAGLGTTITGKVYDPAGVNPLYNATVYIPVNATASLPAFTTGATCNTCGGAAALNAVSVTTTATDGSFTLTSAPSGQNIPVVVQMGKWRREILLSTVLPCVANSVTGNCTAAAGDAGTTSTACMFRLPANHTDGYNPADQMYDKADLPEMAMVTGSADPLECILLKAGISTSEFSSYDVNPSAKVHFYQSPNAPGTSLDPAYGSVKTGDVLWLDSVDPSSAGAPVTAPHYDYYDVVLDACEGSSIDKEPLYTSKGGGEPYKNLIHYTDIGGRAFLTHYSYVWLEYPGLTPNPKGGSTAYVTGSDNWGGQNGVANWIHKSGTTNTQDPMTANVVQSFTKGQAFASWLQNVGASTTAGQLVLHQAREDLTTVGTSSQAWMTATNSYPPSGVTGNFDPHFTFNTPYGATSANQCGRVVFSDFHVSASALVGSGTGPCQEASQCGFGQVCKGGVKGVAGSCSEPCATAADCHDSTYTCVGATAGTCQPTSCSAGATTYACAIGTCNPAATACWCTADAQCNSGKCVNQGQCPSGACTGASGTGDSKSCQPDANSVCTGTTNYACSNPNLSCNSNHVGCVAPPSLPSPTYACSTSGEACNSGHTGCTCSQNSQCGAPLNHCGGTPTDTSGCQIPAALPSPTPGTYTCPQGGPCDSNHNCTNCTADTQCHGAIKKCVCNGNGCMGTGSGSKDSVKCAVPTSIPSSCTASNYTCSIGTCQGNGNGNGNGNNQSCQCSADSQCGVWGYGSLSCNNNNGNFTDNFSCQTRWFSATCNNYFTCQNGGCVSGVCQCTADSQCGLGSTCTNRTGCANGACTGSGSSDSFGCTTRGTTACTATYTCSIGACNSSHSSCECTADSQCASGHCATWSGCASGACTGASGAGGSDGCIAESFTCTPSTSTCSSGALDPSSTYCWCTNDSQCASGKCATWSGCSGNNCTGTGSGQTADHCVAETLPTCNGSCSSGAIDPSNSHCWCTNDNQCTSGKCATWSGCSGNNCTGASGQGQTTDNCLPATPAPTCVATVSNYMCPSGVSGTCNMSNNCQCTADAQCGTGGKCVNWSGCASGACTGSGQANDRGCLEPAVAVPATCTATIPYSCTVGQCNAQGTACQCTADAQCPSGKCVDVGQGCQTINGVDQCSGTGTPDAAECMPSNVANCTSNSDCGGIAGTSVEACSGSGGDSGAGPGLGTCHCSSNTNCGLGMTCLNGVCTGCTSNSQCTDRTYAATCGGAIGAVTGQCCSASNQSSCGLNSHLFPEACLQSPMSDQEKALEFMFFDLTACVTPDTGTPATPPVMLTPQTFALDFVANCSTAADGAATPGLKPQWREFDYQVSFPNPVNGSSIAFSAQTGPAGADASAFLPASPLALVTSSTNTNVPNYDAILLDTSPGGTGKFTTASPPLASQSDLRIWVTMTPTADQLTSPTLLSWKVLYDCPPAE